MLNFHSDCNFPMLILWTTHVGRALLVYELKYSAWIIEDNDCSFADYE
jgi:hypothetical protein